ncbi:hypothetical protein RHSIM_Rhsim12G0097900 [Rhododendron simsii]|uniref:Uncharacterized protein n=1 Tax=Rhododendron simsii TaxID=118357 RepID=A0A834G7P9_RHOSS|nr:hypothetical protein RHSIM_Rhsim12G0097900 [Rhododendron simsii]
MCPFLRYFLADYNLAPIQVTVNTWRILCSAIRLAESNNLSFTFGDLMLMYTVSRNPKYDKYYLTIHQYFDHLVDRLNDTEKWGNVLVKVSGNFEWGPINPLLDHPFPTRTDCSTPNKGLFITNRWPYLIALLWCAYRDALTLLGYEPMHWNAVPSLRSLHLLAIGAKAATGANPHRPAGATGSPPVDATIEKPHSRSRRQRPSIAEGEDQRALKKVKAAGDVDVLKSGLAEDDPSNPDESSTLFIPDFECSDGHVIAVGDSLKESPLLAMTLLKGLALPKDMKSLPTGKAKIMAKLCLFLAKAGQCASKAFGDIDVLLETKRPLRGDLQAKRKEAQQFADQIEALEAEVPEAHVGLQERDPLLL